jgi:hypothetical protein
MIAMATVFNTFLERPGQQCWRSECYRDFHRVGSCQREALDHAGARTQLQRRLEQGERDLSIRRQFEKPPSAQIRKLLCRLAARAGLLPGATGQGHQAACHEDCKTSFARRPA